MLKSFTDAIFTGIFNLSIGKISAIGGVGSNDTLQAMVWNQSALNDLRQTMGQIIICDTSGCIEANRNAQAVAAVNQSLLNTSLVDLTMHADSAKAAVAAKSHLELACDACRTRSIFNSFVLGK